MNKKTVAKQKIENAIISWQQKRNVAEFFKDKLGENGNADKIADNIILRALTEEKPEWTKVLLDTMKTEQKAETTNNVFFGAASLTNEKLQKIIDVTPKQVKSKIEELI